MSRTNVPARQSVSKQSIERTSKLLSQGKCCLPGKKTRQFPIYPLTKCQHLTTGRRRSKTTTAEIAFSLDDTALPAPTLVNDLGILIDSGLTFSAHIDKITSKAYQRSYLIRKCFRSRDTNILPKAFKTYVRPLVEGNSSVWSPHLIKDIRKVESVQRWFTKKIARSL